VTQLARWALVALWAVSAPAAVAHTGGTTGHATVTVSGQSIRYSLNIPADSPATNHRLDELARQIARYVVMGADGRDCAPVPQFVMPPAPGRANVTAVVLYACAAPVRSLSIRHDLAPLFGVDFHALADIDWPGGHQQVLFEAARPEATIAVAGAAEPPPGSFALGVLGAYLA
jgi:hypothetical protein